jgi:hypothetical protein
MIHIYVKHYLTPVGGLYFNKWFNLVYSIMSKQKGFVSFTKDIHKDRDDCFNLSLIFEDQESLDRWVEYPSHDELVDALDPYRNRSYWEVAVTENKHADPSTLEWEQIVPRNPPQ